MNSSPPQRPSAASAGRQFRSRLPKAPASSAATGEPKWTSAARNPLTRINRRAYHSADAVRMRSSISVRVKSLLRLSIIDAISNASMRLCNMWISIWNWAMESSCCFRISSTLWPMESAAANAGALRGVANLAQPLERGAKPDFMVAVALGQALQDLLQRPRAARKFFPKIVDELGGFVAIIAEQPTQGGAALGESGGIAGRHFAGKRFQVFAVRPRRRLLQVDGV